jgi:hypothetical protein
MSEAVAHGSGSQSVGGRCRSGGRKISTRDAAQADEIILPDLSPVRVWEFADTLSVRLRMAPHLSEITIVVCRGWAPTDAYERLRVDSMATVAGAVEGYRRPERLPIRRRRR